MTISSATNRVRAQGNNSAVTFSFSPMVVFEEGDIRVITTDTDGVETERTLGSGTTNFSVTVSEYPGTGSVTYPATLGTKLQAGEYITILRDVPHTQEVDLENQGGYFPDTHEEAFDRAVVLIQQLQEEVDRCAKITEGQDPDDLDDLNDAISSLYAILDDISAVAAIDTDVTAVADIDSDVIAVAAIDTDVTTVAGIAADVSGAVAASQFKYLFDSSTSMADPGTGDLRMNNATIASVTAIALSNTFSGGGDISDFIATWDDAGHTPDSVLTLRKKGDADGFAIFGVTSVTDNGAWLQLAVTHLASGGLTLSASDVLYIGNSRSGTDGLGSVTSVAVGTGLTTGGGAITSTGTIDLDLTSIGSDTPANDDYIIGTDTSDSNNETKFTVNQVLGTVTGLTGVSAATGDEVLINDVSDSNNPKKVTVSSILSLSTSGFTLGTEQNLSGGLGVTFGSIPSGVKQIIITVEGASNAGDAMFVEIGDAGGLETAGYTGTASSLTNAPGTSQATLSTAFLVATSPGASNAYDGQIILTLKDAANFTWTMSSQLADTDATSGQAGNIIAAGSKSLSAELTQLAFKTVSSNFDAGSVNISYM